MKRVICGDVEHDVKVTRVAPGVWGIRVFVNGEINQESSVDDRTRIGAEIRSMLRMEDKCGNFSGMAYNSRMRPGRYGALDLFMQQSEDPAGILTPELKTKAESSIGNTLQTPVIDYDGGVTIGNTRSVTIADSENTSQMYTITFATYSWGFTIVPAMSMNNEISMQQDFERKFNKYLYKFGETLDAAAVAALAAAKTQVFADLLQYTQNGNVVQAPWKRLHHFHRQTGCR